MDLDLGFTPEEVSHQYPVFEQLRDFGLTLRDVKNIGGKVLDIGCGIDANLVRHLRDNDIDAEGIDPLVRGEEDFLIKQEVAGVKPNPGYIPRENSTYKLILGYMNPLLFVGHFIQRINRIMKGAKGNPLVDKRSFRETNKQIREYKRNARQKGKILVQESLRLLDKNGGKIIFYLGIGVLEQDLTSVFKKYDAQVRTEELFHAADMEEHERYRTVITCNNLP